MGDVAQELGSLRRRIDALDDELVRLLDCRAALARDVAKVKQASGDPVLDEDRERRIVERLLTRSSTEARFPDEEMRAIFRCIFEGSRRMQHERIHGALRTDD